MTKPHKTTIPGGSQASPQWRAPNKRGKYRRPRQAETTNGPSPTPSPHPLGSGLRLSPSRLVPPKEPSQLRLALQQVYMPVLRLLRRSRP